MTNSSVEMRPSDQQLEALANFLAENPGVAKGCLRTAHGRRQVKIKWAAFAKHVNSLGGAEKNRIGWAKYWADKKCSLKKTCTQKRNFLKEAGRPADFFEELSPIEQRLVAVMGGELFAVGDSRTFVVDAFPSSVRSKINNESPPVSTPGSPDSPADSTESLGNHSPAREQSPHSPHQRQRDGFVLDQAMNSVAEIEKTRVAAELTTATALSRAVEQMSHVTTAIEGLSKATTEGAQVVADALNRIAEALGRKKAQD